MDRSKKIDKQTLYEIYRACRLCGAGAGYKMPIIQNLVKVDGEQIELRQKIRECLQLEVNSNDKMPPLICELCVDKLDDFYEFLSTCRQTDTNTRKRLGLPSQDTPSTTKVTPAPVKVNPTKDTLVAKKVVSKDIGTETCMLGLIDAKAVKQDIYIVGKPSNVKKTKRNRVKKEDVKQESPIKLENSPTQKSLASKEIKENRRKIELCPKRTTRQNYSLDELIMTNVQKAPKTRPGPKSRKVETKDEPPPQPTRAKEKEDQPQLTKKEDEQSKSKVKKERDDEPQTKLKRVREREVKTDLTAPPAKKTKSSEPSKPHKSSKPPPKPVQTLSKTVQPDGVQCPACSAVLKNSVGFKNHMHQVHPVTWTPDNLACNACQDWFSTIAESVAHHKKHTYYKCLKCKKKYKNGVLYHQHVENKRCLPEQDVPDVRCDSCSSTFPTNNLLKEHRCTDQDSRQGVKCSKCNRKFILLKNLTKHESICTFGKKVPVEPQPSIDPDVKKKLLPMEVRITKCDVLLQYGPVVSACTVPHRFGLDRKMSYPYMPKLRVIKQPTFDPMVSFQDEYKDEFTMDDLNWGDFEDIELKTVKKLSTLCLKVIFSSKMLGELEVLDEIEVARRLALRKRINSIIFKFDDVSSTNSDSILDKNDLTKTFEVVNDKFGSEDNNYHSDSTVFDVTNDVGDEGRGFDAKIDDLDSVCVDNHDKSANLGRDSRIDNEALVSSVLGNTDVQINKPCATSIVNVKEPSDGHLELSKTHRDDVKNHSSSNFSAVSEDMLDNGKFDVNKLNMVKNSTDTVNENDSLLKENTKFDNITSSNNTPSLNNIGNSTNNNDSIIMTENHDILSKMDDEGADGSKETGIKLSEYATTTEDTSFSNDTEEPSDSVIEQNVTLTNHDENSKNNSDISDSKNHTETMEIDTEANNSNHDSVNNEDITENTQNHHDDGKNTEVENMDIDVTCSKNSLNLENMTKVSDNSDTESIGKVSYTKIDIENAKSEDSHTKNLENIKNMSSSSDNIPNHDILQNINEIETTSPTKGNKSLDFSVTGILNHVTSKTIDPDPKTVAINFKNTSNKNDTAIDAKEPENETKNDKINNDKQSLENLSLNDENSSVKSDYNDKPNDTIIQNSVFTNTLKQNEDTVSLNSMKYTVENSNVNNSDKFDLNDLSEDERKLMAELDEQIGETDEKIDDLNDNRDLNLENFNDGYNFD